ncbi:MAG: hypothetical protein QGI58_06150 [Candidatus Thalassarchaeaceae archaeon]|nr:hypothetical protein [Candidatus Thalassarchaeaceae archaeon]
MVFDKFKNWRKGAAGPTVECPLCQTLNPEDTMQCSQCMYQLGKAAFEQVASIDDKEAGSLFDELLADFDEDEEEEVIDWSKGTFTMDDVTIDVEQYGKGDGIKVSGNPTFAMTVDHPDPVDEEEGDYELTAADAPAFVTKFEMPESEPEPLEEVPSQQIELIQPTAESAENVEVVAADAIPDRNGSFSEPAPAAEKPAPSVEESPEIEPQVESEPENAEEESEAEPEVTVETQVESTEMTEKSLLLLKKVELVEMAEAEGLSPSGTKAELAARIIAGPQEIEEVAEPVLEPKSEAEPVPKSAPQPPIVVPAAPAGMPPPPPPAAAKRVDPMDAAFDGGANPPRIPRIPKIPTMPHIAQANEALDMPENNGFWPWPQQEEWPNREVALKIKEAMEEAKRKNVAQVMVLLDEVGPHLGDRTKLLYPIGALLQRVGRASAVDQMIAAAVEAEPDDKDVQAAKAKLRP